MTVLIQSKTNARGERDLRGLLTCGHWGQWVCDGSSTWDFPMEEQFCPEHHDCRYFDIKLQVALMGEEQIESEEVWP